MYKNNISKSGRGFNDHGLGQTFGREDQPEESKGMCLELFTDVEYGLLKLSYKDWIWRKWIRIVVFLQRNFSFKNKEFYKVYIEKIDNEGYIKNAKSQINAVKYSSLPKGNKSY